MMKHKLFKLFFLIVISISILSCDMIGNSEQINEDELIKNLDGKWILKSVARNGVDITGDFDFSKFVLNLNADGTYSFDNYLPFAVKDDGTWSVDDPQYPYHLIFKEGTTEEEITVGINYPIVKGERHITITTSPGCYVNSYLYEFMRLKTN